MNSDWISATSIKCTIAEDIYSKNSSRISTNEISSHFFNSHWRNEIISEFFKNVAAICCSDKVTTEKVDEHQRKCFIWKFNCHFSQELKLHPFVTLKEKVRFTHMQYASSNMQKSCCHANRQNDLKLLHRYMKLQNNKLLFMLGRDRAALF